jgi:hypothetical protein
MASHKPDPYCHVSLYFSENKIQNGQNIFNAFFPEARSTHVPQQTPGPAAAAGQPHHGVQAG